jgi:hypothetical protein
MTVSEGRPLREIHTFDDSGIGAYCLRRPCKFADREAAGKGMV